MIDDDDFTDTVFALATLAAALIGMVAVAVWVLWAATR